MGIETDRSSVFSLPVHRVQSTSHSHSLEIQTDLLAVEEPLEIRLEYGPTTQRERRSLSITMRTPGHDFDLAVGFLFTEGIVQTPTDVRAVEFCGPSKNVVRVELEPGVAFDLKKVERHFYTSSSCGVCGKASIDALRIQSQYTLGSTFSMPIRLIHQLPARLRERQGVFNSTGGLHACASFDARAQLEESREDVGRHNALDKLIGHAFLAGKLPLQEQMLLVSGRASFELVQKAAMAGFPMFAAVGAPSSLAVELAREAGMTLIGFVRDQRFNIYCGEERVTS